MRLRKINKNVLGTGILLFMLLGGAALVSEAASAPHEQSNFYSI